MNVNIYSSSANKANLSDLAAAHHHFIVICNCNTSLNNGIDSDFRTTVICGKQNPNVRRYCIGLGWETLREAINACKQILRRNPDGNLTFTICESYSASAELAYCASLLTKDGSSFTYIPFSSGIFIKFKDGDAFDVNA